jgi:hypothetical protein
MRPEILLSSGRAPSLLPASSSRAMTRGDVGGDVGPGAARLGQLLAVAPRLIGMGFLRGLGALRRIDRMSRLTRPPQARYCVGDVAGERRSREGGVCQRQPR